MCPSELVNTSEKISTASQTDFTLNDTAMHENGSITKYLTLQTPPFSESTLQSDDRVKFYSGLPNFKILKTVFDHVAKAT